MHVRGSRLRVKVRRLLVLHAFFLGGFLSRHLWGLHWETEEFRSMDWGLHPATESMK